MYGKYSLGEYPDFTIICSFLTNLPTRILPFSAVTDRWIDLPVLAR